MATPAAVLSILVKAQGVQATSAQLTTLDKSARKAGTGIAQVEGHAKRGSKTFSALGTAAKTAGPLIGAVGLAAGIKTAVGEFREAQKAGAQTNAVLKSTGNAANVTKKHLENLAGAISKKSGIDDEAIQTGGNLLLTFRGIRNETGKGNKIFDQATQVITDMSVSLNQGLKPSAIQVGKALNDPVKGLTALSRVGVTFTEAQKKQVEALVKSGDKLGAQKLILRELKAEFAGSAAAQATAGDKLKVSLGNLAEAAGGILVPMLDKAAKALTTLVNQFVEGKGVATFIIPVFVGIRNAIASTIPVIGQIVHWLGTNDTVARGVGTALGLAKNGFDALKGVATGVAGAIVGFVNGLKQGKTWAALLAGGLAGLAAALVTIKVVTLTVAAATKAYAIAQGILNVVMAANPLVALGVVLAVVAGALVALELKTHFVEKAWGKLKQAFAAVINWIGNAAATAFGIVKSAAEKGLLGPVPLIITRWGDILAFFKALPGKIGNFLSSLPGYFVKLGGEIAKGVIDGLSMLGHLILNKFKDAANFVIKNVGGLFKDVGGAIAKGVGKINPFGDGIGKTPGKGSASLMGARSSLAPFAAIGARNGLHVSSGLRPGAITSSGNQSYHSTGEAIDLAGPAAGMMATFRTLRSKFGSRLAELIYTPGGVGIKNGQPFTYTGQVAKDHFDHVHVAFDTGKPGVGDGIGKRLRAHLAGDGYGKSQLETLWRRGGGPASAANMAAAIALAESGGRSTASHRNSDGSIDRGLWQINSTHGAMSTFNPLGNARAAVSISGGGRNWNPWTVFRTGAYKKFLGAAKKGAAAKKKGHAVKPAGHVMDRTTGRKYGAGGFSEQQIAEINAQAERKAASMAPTASGSTGDGSTDDNTDAINALNAQIEILNRKIDAQTQLAQEALTKYNVSQSQYGALAKAIADVASGQIGGRIGLGFMSPGFAGGGSRY